MAFDFKSAVQGKALAPHPSFMDSNTPVSVYSPGATRKDAVISQQEASRHLSAYGGNQAMDWVASCVELYADAAASAPFVLAQQNGDPYYEFKSQGTPPDASAGPKELYELLHRPNPFMLYDELMSLLVIDLLMVGNAYWAKWRVSADGKPLALYRLAPGYVKIKPGSYGPARYEYQPPGAKDPIFLSPEEVVHFRRPNPHSAYYGLGVIQAAGRMMDLELAIVDTMASYFENKADPSLIVSSERKLSRDTFNKLRAQLRARVAGTGRAGELLVLESGLKASTLSASASDAMFDKLATMSRDRILSKFRVSPMLIGDTEAGSGSTKPADARREFDNYTLRPFLAKLERQISNSLTSAWDVEFKIDYRTILPPDDASKIGGEIAKIPGIKIREVRAQYAQFGIPESTGDPEADEMLLNMPTPEMDANGQAIDPRTGQVVSGGALGADQPLPGEAGRPPKPSNTRAIKTSGKKALDLDEVVQRLSQLEDDQRFNAQLVKVLSPEAKALSSINQAGERVTVGNRLPDEKRPSDPFATARQVDIDMAMSDMAMNLRGLANVLQEGLIAELTDGKALKTSDIVKRINQSDAWADFKQRLETILVSGASKAAQSGAMHANRAPDDDLDYSDLARSVVHRPDGLRSILATVKQRVVNRIKDVRDANGERGDYEAAIRGSLSDWADRQVGAIADSEATEAYNEGVLTMFELAGESDVYVVEEADAPDEACQEAAGQVWPISHARAHRKEHPRCRRSFLSVADVAVD